MFFFNKLLFYFSFSPGHSLFHTEKPCQTAVYSPAQPRVEKVSLSRYDTQFCLIKLCLYIFSVCSNLSRLKILYCT